jgi:hypothetical protein
MKNNYTCKNTNEYLLIFFSILIFPFGSFCQNYSLIGDRSFGTIGTEGEPLILKYNNNIIVAGRSNYTGINGDKSGVGCFSEDVWMLKLDQNMNIIWDKTYGGLAQDEIHGITLSSNNSIVFSGETSSDSTCDISTQMRGARDFWYFMLDSNGTKLLDRRYGSNNVESGGKLTRSSSGDYLIFGGSDGGISGDKSTPAFGGNDYWLVRTDSLGNKLWDRTYGGNGAEVTVSITDYFISKTRNNECLIGGRTYSGISGTISVNGFGDSDIWVAKIDSVGNIIWDKRFGGSSLERTGKMIEVNDGYILLGSSMSKTGGTISDTGIAEYDVWIVKMDTSGNQLWEKRYGGVKNDISVDIQEAPDGGFWVLANTFSPAGYDISENSFGIYDYWIFKIDTAGNKIWDKRFGGPGNDEATSFLIMPDSSIYICGSAQGGLSPVKTDSGNGGYDYWVVHFNYYNNTTGLSNYHAANGVTLSPNPTKGFAVINGLPQGRFKTTLVGLDGRVIRQSFLIGGSGINYSLEGLSPGMYLLRFSGDEFEATVKVVKE